MSIRRSPRPKSNFYQLDKSISEDSRLSWSARGLLIYLLGKPDNWVVSISHLTRQTIQAAKRSGRDAVYAILSELETTGYLQRQPLRSKGGAFSGVEYTVSEIAAVSLSSKSYPDSPDTPCPYPANPTQVNIDYHQKNKKETTIRKSCHSYPASVPRPQKQENKKCRRIHLTLPKPRKNILRFAGLTAHGYVHCLISRKSSG